MYCKTNCACYLQDSCASISCCSSCATRWSTAARPGACFAANSAAERAAASRSSAAVTRPRRLCNRHTASSGRHAPQQLNSCLETSQSCSQRCLVYRSRPRACLPRAQVASARSVCLQRPKQPRQARLLPPLRWLLWSGTCGQPSLTVLLQAPARATLPASIVDELPSTVVLIGQVHSLERHQSLSTNAVLDHHLLQVLDELPTLQRLLLRLLPACSSTCAFPVMCKCAVFALLGVQFFSPSWLHPLQCAVALAVCGSRISSRSVCCICAASACSRALPCSRSTTSCSSAATLPLAACAQSAASGKCSAAQAQER
jgi:hypothetical protein